MGIRITACVLIAACGTAVGQSTYIGPIQGSWSDPANWSPFGVPDNSLGGSFNAILPAGSHVVFDMPLPTQISGASFEAGSRIDLFNSSLEVLGIAILQQSVIDADGPSARFETHAPFVSGINQRAWATNGASVDLQLSSYIASFDDWRTSAILLSADGEGSMLDMSHTTLVDISGTFGRHDPFTYQILAKNNGVVNLSGVATIKGARSGYGDFLRFRAESGGLVNLSSVNAISGGDTWIDLAGGAFDFSSLDTISSNTRISVPSSQTLDLPSLTSVTNTSIDLQDGGTINAPVLFNLVRSSLYLNPARNWNSPPFTKIDHSIIHVSGGASFAVADDQYLFTRDDWRTSASLLSADGLGSLLDMSSVNLIDASGTFGRYDPFSYQVVAKNNGLVNFSGATTIYGARSGYGDYLRFRAESGGAVNLSNVVSVDGGDTWFDLAGGTVDLSSLQAINSNTKISVPLFQTLNLPSLTSAVNLTFDIQDGGVVNAPLLSSFVRSYLYITPLKTLNTLEFTSIDHSRIHVAQGATWVVADDQYQFTRDDWRTNATLLSANGVGSFLDLSSIHLVDASGTFGRNDPFYYQILATNSGVVDLSGATTVHGARSGYGDYLRFQAEQGGTLILGSIEHSSGDFWLASTSTNSIVQVLSDLTLGVNGGNPRISATSSGEIHIGGDFVHRITNESNHATANGTLQMNGQSALQSLEVAGVDLGLPAGAITDNFNWGTLIVGQDSVPTTVELVDSIDNGNRGPGGEQEILYISGFPASNALQIRGGSTLILNGIQVYAFQNDQWVDINALIEPGEFRIPFENGFIQLARCDADLTGDGSLDFFDVSAFLQAFGNGDLAVADFNGDGQLDFFDVSVFLQAFSTGCSA